MDGSLSRLLRVTLDEVRDCLKASREGRKVLPKSRGRKGGRGGKGWEGWEGWEGHEDWDNGPRLDFRGAREDSGSDKGRSMDARNVWSSCFKRVTFFFHFSLLIF